MDKFWKWVDSARESDADTPAPESRTLYLDGAIAAETWMDDDITPALFREELFSGDGPITVWINSPGGDCIAASQIYTMLMDYPSDVTVKIDGLAASAASVIAMAGTKVLMSPTAMMMIHNPATVAAGDHGEMQKAIEMLDEVKESIINAYEIKTSLSRAKISHMMEEETWLNARKAVELGFADGILEDEKHSVDITPYAFSRKVAQAALLNKLTARVKQEQNLKQTSELGQRKIAPTYSESELNRPKSGPINSEMKAAESFAAVDTQENEPMGRSVDELKERLLTIKNFL